MCGIVFINNNNGKKASKMVMKRYKNQSKRGTQGYGAVSIENGAVKKVYRSENENGIRVIYGDNAPTMLFHHRTPTSTPNLEECTHPIFVSHKDLDHNYLVVHNGVISNDTELKKDFEKDGYVYTTEVQSYYKTGGTFKPSGRAVFNDSESLAIDLAIAIEEGTKKTRANGSIAFIAIQYRKTDNEVLNIFYGRNNRNPLVLDRRSEGIIIASEGSGEEVTPHRLFKLNIHTNEISSRDFDVGLNYINTHNNTPLTYPSTQNTQKSMFPKDYHSKRTEEKPLDIVKKLDSPITKMSIHCLDTDTWIDIRVKNFMVYRTTIDVALVGYVKTNEWNDYIKFSKEIDCYDEIQKNHKEYGLELTQEDIKSIYAEYKRLYMWMGAFSKLINGREKTGEKEVSEKF